MKMRRNGFTIVEIMVVVIILGLLAAFIVPGMFEKLGQAKTKIARSKMAIIENALEQFAINCGRLPTDEEGLDALLVAPAGLEDKWVSLGIKASHIIDPWDNPYIYVQEGMINVGSYDLISLGADGADQGEGENADIFNE